MRVKFFDFLFLALFFIIYDQEERIKVTGSLQTKQLKSGKSYQYVRLSYKNEFGKWCTKTVATHLETKNNKRKAKALINTYIEQYTYLEECDGSISPNISLCDYMDYWLEGKEGQLKRSTYEGYGFRVKRIKQYFKEKDLRLVEVTPKILDTFFKYALKYGKINQKSVGRYRFDRSGVIRVFFILFFQMLLLTGL